MGKAVLAWVAATLVAWGAGAAAAELTVTEQVWLQAARPVLVFARQQGLPLDIVVQPQPTPDETPVGLAFVDGRCKLVLSMRGNPQAQATLDSMAPDLLGPIVEAIVAHELGHCWRHLTRTWGTLPDGLVDVSGLHRVTPEQADLLRDMWRTRREEGFADLVGLAWTLQHHAAHYEAVHAWHVRLRAEQAVDTGPHDTRVWVRLAGDKAGFGSGATVFDQVGVLWLAGLLAPPDGDGPATVSAQRVSLAPTGSRRR